ncbi:MAG: hypothetical protein ACRDZ2_12380 [Ilumatobacteraceae bacterium]
MGSGRVVVVVVTVVVVVVLLVVVAAVVGAADVEVGNAIVEVIRRIGRTGAGGSGTISPATATSPKPPARMTAVTMSSGNRRMAIVSLMLPVVADVRMR